MVNNNAIQVAQVVSTYPPYRGGMGNIAYAYTEKLRQKGHNVMVYTPDYGASAAGQDHIRYLKPLIRYGNAAFLPQLPLHLKQADIIHLHLPFFGGAEWLAFTKPKAPLVISYHMDVHGSGFLKPVFKTHRKLFFKKILNRADKILVSTRDYADHSWLAAYPEFQNRIEILPFGVDEAFLPAQNREEDEPCRFLFVAGLDKAHYFKGLDVLLKALVRIKDLHWSLEVVGSGELRPDYERTAANLLIRDRVRFLGGLSKQELIAAYQRSNATVLPSIDRSESFGLVLIESMACGTPVIASDLPGVRSVLVPGSTGFLAKTGDAYDLAEILKKMIALDKPAYQRMREASARLVEQTYRWPRIISRLEGIYRELV